MSLASLSKQTMQVAARSGTTYTGDPAYDTAATHLGRVSYRNKRILTAAGVERVSTAHITVETPVYDADLITLLDGNRPAARRENGRMTATEHSTIPALTFRRKQRQ